MTAMWNLNGSDIQKAKEQLEARRTTLKAEYEEAVKRIDAELADIETVERVASNLGSLQEHFDVPLILENSPQYFDVPGSSLSMVDFVSAVVKRCKVGLLLDLTHFVISMLNTKKDPLSEIDRMPLEQVVEVHVSGLNVQSGIAWDDHALPAPPVVFDLLERVMKHARPKAVTLEYNWSPQFPESMLVKHIDRVHKIVRC